MLFQDITGSTVVTFQVYDSSGAGDPAHPVARQETPKHWVWVKIGYPKNWMVDTKNI
jgi:hypothetical protein